MKKRRMKYSRNMVLAWGLLSACVTVSIYTVMAVIDASYWTLHWIMRFIGLGLAALSSLIALNAFQMYFKSLSRRLRCKDRRQGAPNKFAQGVPSGGRSCGLPVLCAPSRVYTKMPSSACSPGSPPNLSHLSPAQSKSLRSWYRSPAYAYNFPARREDYMTDLKILKTFLRCEEKKERSAQLCGIRASGLIFWDYRCCMDDYSRALMADQYQVACMPQGPFTHKWWPPPQERRSR